MKDPATLFKLVAQSRALVFPMQLVMEATCRKVQHPPSDRRKCILGRR